MATTDKHRWQFAGRFRRNAFGWRSQPAIQRVREAVSEIKGVARRDALLGAEGAVLFLEKVEALPTIPAHILVDGKRRITGCWLPQTAVEDGTR
jgi:hypothetical protein